MEVIETNVAKFNITDSAIAEMGSKYLDLKINGINDKDGYLAVREARIKVKGARIDVEHKRKELKEESLRYGRLVDAEAKRITDQLLPIEAHLELEQGAIDTEKARIKDENAKADAKRLADRLARLVEFGIDFKKIDIIALGLVTDEMFEVEAARAEAAFKEKETARLAEDARVAAENLRMKEVSAAQEAERLRLDAIDKEQKAAAAKVIADAEAAERKLRSEQLAAGLALKAAQDEVAAERKAFEDEKNRAALEATRAAEMEIAKAEAAAKAVKDAEDAAKVEAFSNAERAKALAEEQARIESLKPDAEKLELFAAKIAAMSAQLPDVSKTESKVIVSFAFQGLITLADSIRTMTKESLKLKPRKVK